MYLGQGMRQTDIEKALRRDKEFLDKKLKARESDMADMKKLYYAGIGSRQTPDYILALMRQLGERLRDDMMILRTGHANGADQAFEWGAGAAAQIFLPWRTFNQDDAFIGSKDENGNDVHPMIYNDPTQEARVVAAQYHPAWAHLGPGPQNLHARNAHIILGPKPQSRPTKVEFVICWTPDGKFSGGTGQALRIAHYHGIPIYNLYDEDVYDFAFEWAWGDD
jgi:hypothetical protein